MKFRKYPIKEDYFDTWTSNMAYVLGFITADGNVSKYSLSIELQKQDLEVLEFIREQICPAAPIKITKKKSKEYARLRLNSTILVKDLAKYHVVENKTSREKVPEIPKDLWPDYLRGLFDGDGTVQTRRNSIEGSIVSANKKFLEDINQKIGNLGSIRTRKKKNDYYCLDMWSRKFIQFRDLIYNNNFSLKRKRDICFSDFYIRSPKYWTEEQVQILKSLYVPGRSGTIEKISQTTNKSYKAVTKKVWELGLSGT